MSFWALFVVAVALSMDAFAVSVGKGMSMSRVDWGKAVIVGLYFGVFQAIMPLLGYALADNFQDKIVSFDHWIAFALLCFLGIKMIVESRGEEEPADASLAWRVMLVLAIATSIDALAMGVTFAFLQVAIIPAVILIGTITFCISVMGVRLGHFFGVRHKHYAELIGGLILIAIGVKILIEHLVA